jgi:transposase
MINRGHDIVNLSLHSNSGLTGKRRYRTYSPEFKRELVEASLDPKASIAQIAMRHDVNPNLLHNWRAQYLSGDARWFKQPSMLPVVTQPESRTPTVPVALDQAGSQAETRYIEIDVAQRVVRIHGPLDRQALQMALDCLR